MAQMPLSPSIECPTPELPPGAQGVVRVAVDDVHAQLVVTFHRAILLPQQAYLFDPRSYSLTGGQRLFPHILRAEPHQPASPPDFELRRVRLTLDGLGDFSVYTLTVSGPDIDPFFSSAKLRFRLACDDPFDCRLPLPEVPPEPELPVAIDYLAKDYAGFRRALLDFIPTRLPAWTERSEADIGLMVLELFSATADTLSYMQDRVANEAFLNSATQRRSVAGHLALIGYQMDEGASAYTWLQFQVNAVQILPDSPGFKVSNRPSSDAEPVIVFETLGRATLDPRHNAMFLYNWNNQDCCLPRQEHSAALVGSFDGLKAGDYLLFDDGRGHRDVVRLIASPQIIQAEGMTSPPVGSPPGGSPHPDLTLVRWSDTTPLRYDYCAADVTVRGNLVPATHGETIADDPLRDLSDEQKLLLIAEIAARRPGQRPPRQRLRLANGPLAHLDPNTLNLAAPLVRPPSQTALTSASVFTTRQRRSVSTLTVQVDDEPWSAQPTLLESGPDAKVFRVEIDDNGDATVVFGDGTFGLRPPETAKVTATYRVGGGSVGNVGADTLTLPHSSAPAPWLISATNPLPAVGGRDLESRDHARRVGPPTSHTPLVAVSAADYQAAAQAFTNANRQQPIQRANATFRWTGSWLTVTLAVDPRGAEGLTPELRRELEDFIDTRRLAGYDLEVIGAIYLPIDLTIEFCVAPGSRAADVHQALLQVLSNADLPDGRQGFFHPDNFSFGDNLYVSQIYAAVMSVPGIESAQITRLARLHAAQPEDETSNNLRQGFLAVGTDQIIRLDNDRNFPENGVLTIRPRGGG
jgi:hypothetical protein